MLSHRFINFIAWSIGNNNTFFSHLINFNIVKAHSIVANYFKLRPKRINNFSINFVCQKCEHSITALSIFDKLLSAKRPIKLGNINLMLSTNKKLLHRLPWYFSGYVNFCHFLCHCEELATWQSPLHSRLLRLARNDKVKIP